MTRDEKINAAALEYNDDFVVDNNYKAFVAGARWADFNKLSPTEEMFQEIIERIKKLENKND